MGARAIDDLVSVIVPVYNAENSLECCIKSIVTQRYFNLEIILIDDGSTDSSGIICDNFKSVDNRVKVVHELNRGVSYARNIGLAMAEGKYIAFVDADDEVDPGYISEMVNCKKKDETRIIMCGYTDKYLFDNYETIHVCPFKKEGVLFEDYSQLLSSSIGYVLFFPVAKLYDLNIIRKYKISFDDNLKWGEDQVFNMRYFEHVKNYLILPMSLYSYMHRGVEGASERMNGERFSTEKVLLNYRRKWLWKNNIAEKEKALTYFLSVAVYAFGKGIVKRKDISLYSQYYLFENQCSDIADICTYATDYRSFKFFALAISMRTGIILPLFLYFKLKFNY